MFGHVNRVDAMRYLVLKCVAFLRSPPIFAFFQRRDRAMPCLYNVTKFRSSGHIHAGRALDLDIRPRRIRASRRLFCKLEIKSVPERARTRVFDYTSSLLER